MAGDSEPYPLGVVVPFHFEWYMIVVSYFISFLGAITTVELLHRRKARHGWLKWLQLGSCAISFGLVAIWCMHFVGNRAIVLGNGEPDIQLYYDSGNTAGSAFLPISFLLLAFWGADRNVMGTRLFYPYLAVIGFFAGMAIVGMHYIGNRGIQNYDVHNDRTHIVVSGVIATVACFVALTIFFVQKERFINVLWRRCVCAAILAGAVSSMHWVASLGSTYRLKNVYSSSTFSKQTNLILAIVFSVFACIACLSISYWAGHGRRQLQDMAKQIVLATATFDREGRVLVSRDGLIPCKKITKQYYQRSLDDEFTVGHEIYQWMFRVSYNWPGIADLIPAMKTHLQTTGNLKGSPRPGSSARSRRKSFDEPADEDEDHAIFREHFCVAASELAKDLGIPLARLGRLYHEMLMTYTLTGGQKFSRKLFHRSSKHTGHSADPELGSVSTMLIGKGQLLFLTRQVDEREATRLINDGFRFVDFALVGDTLSKALEVQREDLEKTIQGLKAYCKDEQTLSEGGTYLAVFAIRPILGTTRGSWEVLVPKAKRSILPMVQLLPNKLNQWQSDFLSRLDGLSLNQCIVHLAHRQAEVTSSIQEVYHGQQRSGSYTMEHLQFIQMFLDRIGRLLDLMPDQWFRNAILSAKIRKIPYFNTEQEEPDEADVLAFFCIPDVHSTGIKSDNQLIYTSLGLFNSSQRISTGSEDHAILARRNHLKFGKLIAQHTQALQPPPPSKWSRLARSVVDRRYSLFRKTRNTHTQDPVQADNCSERGLVCVSGSNDVDSSGHLYDRIMISQETSVITDAKQDSLVELQQIGYKTGAGVAKTEEEPTFADELFKATSNNWRPPARAKTSSE